MANIEKHGADTLYFIRHNMRQLPHGKAPSNVEIDDKRRSENYSIISRGKTAKQVNEYRKKIEDEIFHYNRKDLVRSIEVVITLPKDCPKEQEEAFFKESYNYVVSTLPMGERCVFLAEVHKDEGRIQKDGETVLESPPHMHIMYVPAVKDEKHAGFEFKLCADQLTKRAALKAFHPNFQKWIDKAGISATVKNGATDGKSIAVAELKKLTKETGLTLEQIKDIQREKSILADNIKEVRENAEKTSTELHKREEIIEKLKTIISEHENKLSIFPERIKELLNEINVRKEIEEHKNDVIEKLKSKLLERDTEKEKIILNKDSIIDAQKEEITELNQSLASKEKQVSELKAIEQTLNEKIKALETELKNKDVELEKAKENTINTGKIENSWGMTDNWGKTSGWGPGDKSKDFTINK